MTNLKSEVFQNSWVQNPFAVAGFSFQQFNTRSIVIQRDSGPWISATLVSPLLGDILPLPYLILTDQKIPQEHKSSVARSDLTFALAFGARNPEPRQSVFRDHNLKNYMSFPRKKNKRKALIWGLESFWLPWVSTADSMTDRANPFQKQTWDAPVWCSTKMIRKFDVTSDVFFCGWALWDLPLVAPVDLS